MSRKPAAAPTRRVLPQYGYRLNETGVEWWGYIDLQYVGGNSTSRKDVVARAESQIELAKTLGITLTYTLLVREHVTTTWSRWLKVREL